MTTHLFTLISGYVAHLTWLHITRSIVLDYAIISLLEYAAHRWFMHRNFARFLNSEYLRASFMEHMQHHGKCYNIFDHEEQPCGLLNLTIQFSTELLVSAPPAVALFFIDPLAACLLPMFALLHGALWSAVHQEMHRPVQTWFSSTSMFRYLNKYHFLHHRHMGTNFNTLFLGWDWLLFTAARATELDLQEIAQATWQVRPNRVDAALLERSKLAREARARHA